MTPAMITPQMRANLAKVLADMKARGMKRGDWLDDAGVIHHASELKRRRSSHA